jgi:hypothetical protein
LLFLSAVVYLLYELFSAGKLRRVGGVMLRFSYLLIPMVLFIGLLIGGKTVLLSREISLADIKNITFTDSIFFEPTWEQLQTGNMKITDPAILSTVQKGYAENLAALKTDKFTRDRASLLADNASAEIPDDEISLKKLVSRLGFEVFDEYVSIREAYGDPLCDKARKRVRDAEDKKECLFLKDLAVSGSDICALGAAGKEIGDILFALLSDVIEGRCENTPEKLRIRASEMITEPIQKGC